jgi:hypothetical protein
MTLFYIFHSKKRFERIDNLFVSPDTQRQQHVMDVIKVNGVNIFMLTNSMLSVCVCVCVCVGVCTVLPFFDLN